MMEKVKKLDPVIAIVIVTTAVVFMATLGAGVLGILVGCAVTHEHILLLEKKL